MIGLLLKVATILIILFFVKYFFTKILPEILVVYYVFQVPGPPKYNIFFGNIYEFFVGSPDQIFQSLRKWGRNHFPIYKMWLLSICCVNLVNPEDIQLLLNDMNHNSKSWVYNILHPWLGSGLLTSNGTKWVQRRKLLTPAFHFNILQDFIAIFNEKAIEFVEIIKKEKDKPSSDITELVTYSTLKIIGETAMGKKMDFRDEKAKNYKKALHDLAAIYIARSTKTYLLVQLFYILLLPLTYLKELRLVKTLQQFTADVILDREKTFLLKNQRKKRLAMLDLLLSNKHQDGSIDNEGIREEVDTFMFEGHDTVSSAIQFGLLLLASHPKIQEEIVQEMLQVLGDLKKQPDYNDLQDLKYMDRCIKEILRLYPSVPFISRVLGKDIIFQNQYKLKKGTNVHVHIYDLHHNPDIYPEPEKFDPDRFLPENCKDRHPYAYIPFSAGPRNCIGQRFAIFEIKVLYCAILANFILKPVDTRENILLYNDLVLRSNQNLQIKFMPRQT